MIGLLNPDRLLYIGLSDTQLTCEMFKQIVQAVAHIPTRRPPGNEKTLGVELEMQSKRAPYEWLGKDAYDEMISRAQERGIRITMTLPKPTAQTDASRNRRRERRARDKAREENQAFHVHG